MDSDTAAKAIQALIHDNNGDDGGATLDSLAFWVDLLRKQPIQYRRAILLIFSSASHPKRTTLSMNGAFYVQCMFPNCRGNQVPVEYCGVLVDPIDARPSGAAGG